MRLGGGVTIRQNHYSKSNLQGRMPRIRRVLFLFLYRPHGRHVKTSILIMIGYVARNYNNGDNIKIILNELKMPTLDKPEALDSMVDGVDKDIYREDVKA